MEEYEIFPRVRERRLRKNQAIRDLVAEVSLNRSNLVQPIFVMHGSDEELEIKSMPGIYRMTVDRAVKYVGRGMEKGIRAFLLFGVASHKDEYGTEAYSEDGIIPLAVRSIKKDYPDAVIITDVCLCEYTSHGHCGIVINGQVDNDATLPYLSRAAVTYAKAGADIVAPSAMMDGQVKAIREALDQNGLKDTIIMSYSSKFASSLYGPFREAADSKPQFGDRRSYQMDYRSLRSALREIELDIKEGADIVMVKPALFYLDVVSRAKERFLVPIAAYSVSGEYSMLRAASRNGWLDEDQVLIEYMTALKRAGADIIITYYAMHLADLIK
ncbi:MAG: porphobilinogen synthase [Nitrososphaeria archaeon]